MSPPTDGPALTVRFDAVEALAAELTALAGELSDDAAICRSTATSLYSALSREEGWSAGSAATSWAALADVLATRTGAVAGTLLSAVAAYHAADAAMAQCLALPRPDEQGGGR
jgi:hypothetical protein